MKVFRVVLIVVGVICIVVGVAKLTVQETNSVDIPYRLHAQFACGSVARGPSHDAAQADSTTCAQARHNDTVAAVALFIIGTLSLGFGIGHIVRESKAGKRRHHDGLWYRSVQSPDQPWQSKGPGVQAANPTQRKLDEWYGQEDWYRQSRGEQ
jgi:hypothetical protein